MQRIVRIEPRFDSEQILYAGAHREFFAALMFIGRGNRRTKNGHPWATTLSGPSGFMKFGGGESAHYQSVLDPAILCIRAFGWCPDRWTGN